MPDPQEGTVKSYWDRSYAESPPPDSDLVTWLGEQAVEVGRYGFPKAAAYLAYAAGRLEELIQIKCPTTGLRHEKTDR